MNIKTDSIEANPQCGSQELSCSYFESIIDKRINGIALTLFESTLNFFCNLCWSAYQNRFDFLSRNIKVLPNTPGPNVNSINESSLSALERIPMELLPFLEYFLPNYTDSIALFLCSSTLYNRAPKLASFKPTEFCLAHANDLQKWKVSFQEICPILTCSHALVCALGGQKSVEELPRISSSMADKLVVTDDIAIKKLHQLAGPMIIGGTKDNWSRSHSFLVLCLLSREQSNWNSNRQDQWKVNVQIIHIWRGNIKMKGVLPGCSEFIEECNDITHRYKVFQDRIKRLMEHKPVGGFASRVEIRTASYNSISPENRLSLPSNAYDEAQQPDVNLSQYWEVKCEDGTTNFALWHPQKTIKENIENIKVHFPKLSLTEENIQMPV
ncbi:MAG: hypothetical protein H0T62_07985 [Parachlamydiaceae bacterium]|nr:hypothetical protein [Parachlamydiaceae bacterium]